MACGGRIAARMAVASPDVQYRVGLQTQSDDPGDQPGHIGKREPFRTALGQVRAERVIQPARCRSGPGSVAGQGGGAGVLRSPRDIPYRTVLAR
jgi:hypothetical protein